MLKRMKENLLKNKSRVWCAGICMMIFILTLIQNFWTQFVSDDWCYLFVYTHVGMPNENSRRVVFLADVIESMKNHWNMWNGRVVAHGLLQLVMGTSYPGFHKVIFNIVNSLMYVGLGVLIYIHGIYKKKDSPLLLFLIYAMMWLYLPQYGATVLWASGAANYLWCSVIILAFLLPYRMYFSSEGNSFRDTWKRALFTGILGLFAGCTNENSGGALALMCILFIMAFLIRKLRIPKWSIAGVIGTIVGAVVLVKAPGNYRVSSKANLKEYLVRGEDVIQKSKNLLLPILIVLIIVLFLAWLSNDGKKKEVAKLDYLAATIYSVGAVASIVVLALAAMRPERTWFISVCLLLTVVAYFYGEIRREYFNVAFVSIMAVVIVAIFSVSTVTTYQDLRSTYTQVKAQSDIINEALETGQGTVQIKIVKPTKNKHDYMSYVNDFSTNGDEWQNRWASLYFGLDKIIGVE